ncbi:MAG: type II and III secretion system protein [Burkholderiaceae bacterium]
MKVNIRLSNQARPPLGCRTVLSWVATATFLAGCAGKPLQPSDYHLIDRPAATMQATKPNQSDIPALVQAPMLPPPPRVTPGLETYSVVVADIEIAELLFAMARDAKINVDVHPAVRGRVTVNAIEQTLPQILTRLARQVDLRYELDGENLVVMPNKAFIRHYAVDYVNIERAATSSTNIATQISSTGGNPLSTGSSGQSNNNSTSSITNTSNNQFWATLVSNLRELIDAEEKNDGSASGSEASSNSSTAAPSGSDSSAPAASAESASTANNQNNRGQSHSTISTQESAAQPNLVFVNRETGIITVRGKQIDHERVQVYLDRVMNSARRQVLIEATIAEVQLSDDFQQGVNWQKLRLNGSGWSFTQQPDGTSPLGTGVNPRSGPAGINFPTVPSLNSGLEGAASAAGAATPALGVLRYLNSGSKGDVGFALSLLQSFGKVKVLSSPKISVMNNQTAVLKVVDNRVYFTIGVQVTPGTDTTAPLVTYTSTPNTVPVGFVMSVTPQIRNTGAVTMNVRPTISRIIGFVNDPNPALAQNGVVSRIPEIQTREIESILKVGSGDIAVMGGLMQESINDTTDAVPGAASLPFVGGLFKYRNDAARKSELVIFLRPIVIKDASLEGDYNGFKKLQPGKDFFRKSNDLPLPRAWTSRSEVQVDSLPPLDGTTAPAATASSR